MHRVLIILVLAAISPSLYSAVPKKIDDDNAHERVRFLKAAWYLELNGHKKLAGKYYRKALSTWQKPSQREHLYDACHQYFKYLFERRKQIPKESRFSDCAPVFRDTYYGRVDRNYIPIHRAEPSFPRGTKFGWVVLRYDISKEGLAENIRVRETTAEYLNRYAIESLQKSFFLPKVEGGKAVVTKDVSIRTTFDRE